MSFDSHTNLQAPAGEPQDLQRIAAELAALGELEASPDELALLELAGGELATSEDERLVGELFRIAEGVGDPELDDLAAQRVWKRVEGQGANTPSRKGGGVGGRVVIGLLFAAAAAVLLVMLPAESADEGANDELGMVAHAGLEALGVDTSPGADARRTRELARSLERTLEEQG